MPPTFDGSTGAERHGCFVVQATIRKVAGAVTARGVIEALQAGEKRPFASSSDVARLLEAWALDGERLDRAGGADAGHAREDA